MIIEICLISRDNKIANVIIIFTVDPEKQQRLTDVTFANTKEVNDIEEISFL
jgi:hypothetical protein